MKNLKSLIEEALYKASHCSDPVIKKKANALAEDSYQMKKVNEFYARSLAEDALYLIRKCGDMVLFNRIITGLPPYELINSAARPLVEWMMSGKTEQADNVSPSNIIYPKGVGDPVNIFDGSKVTNATRVVFNGKPCLRGSDGSAAPRISGIFKENTQYTLTMKTYRNEGVTRSIKVGFYYTDGTDKQAEMYSPNGYKVTFTSDEGKTVESIRIIYLYNTIFYIDLEETILVEAGSPVTSGYKIEFEAKSKNLFNVNESTPSKYLKVPNGELIDSSLTDVSGFIPCKAGEVYTLSYDYTTLGYTDRREILFYSEDGTGVNYSTYPSTGKSFTFTVPNTPNLTKMRFDYDKKMFNIMVAKGTDTDYEPHKAPMVSTVYVDEPLMFRDTLEGNGKGTLTHNMKKLVLTGQENWEETETGSNAYMIENPDGLAASEGNYLWCSHYKDYQSTVITMPDKTAKQSVPSYAEIAYIYIKDNSYTTVEGFKSYLAEQYAKGTPVVIWYPLETPVKETINIPRVNTYSGNSTLDIVTEVAPETAMITYKSTTEE